MLLLTLAACFVVILGKEGKTPLKTKKYKCLEIADDMDIQLVPKSGCAIREFDRSASIVRIKYRIVPPIIDVTTIEGTLGNPGYDINRFALALEKEVYSDAPDELSINVQDRTKTYTRVDFIKEPSWPAEEEFRSIGAAHFGGHQISEEEIETPKAHKVPFGKSAPTATSHKSQEVPRDKDGRPLLLSPAHCKQVKHYANSYGVTDVLSWVGRNCSFAKMFLPTATCEEINTLVASCYKNKST